MQQLTTGTSNDLMAVRKSAHQDDHLAGDYRDSCNPFGGWIDGLVDVGQIGVAC